MSGWLTAVNQNKNSGKFQTQMTSDVYSIMFPYFFEQSYDERTLAEFAVHIYF